VLLNLIGNAVKFTTQGSVDVRVAPAFDAAGVEGVLFEVSDTGCGIPSDKASIIFEAFQQAEGEMNRPYEGTGLGLAISRKVVEMMSGRIWVASKDGADSRIAFTAFFPRTTAESLVKGAAENRLSQASGQLRAGTRTLVAEDNPENVILLQAYLQGLPLVLDFASNGIEVFEKRRRGEYDLVLMDIQMPVMDGCAATREILAWEAREPRQVVPMVALTAHALSGAAAQSLKAGCNGHVSKPVKGRTWWKRSPASPPSLARRRRNRTKRRTR